jgi:hypothetical protein
MDALPRVAALGLDSFLACLVIGAYGVSRAQALGLAATFGACDAAASLLGSIWPLQLPALVAVSVYLVCPLLLVSACRSRRILLFGLPVLLSLDNLCSMTPAAMAPMLGAGSAAMALAGLLVADRVRMRVLVLLRLGR